MDTEDPAATAVMDEEAAANVKMPERCSELTQLQKDIYNFLSKVKWQTALQIAKAMKKTSAKDVNRDLYKMKGLELLDQDSKLWSIKTEDKAEDRGKTEHLNGTETKETYKLTEQQEKIYTFLKNKEPQRANSIAKCVGKSTAKDVNRDLYRMKELGLLSHNKEENLWTIKSPPSAAFDQHESNVSASGYTSTRTWAINHSCPPCNDNSRDNASGAETMPTPLEYTTVDGSNVTEPPTEEERMQNCANRMPPPVLPHKYVINIYNSANIRIGDTVRMISNKESLDPNCATECEQYHDCNYLSEAVVNIVTNHTQHADYDCQTSNNTDASRDYDSGIGSVWTDCTVENTAAQEAEPQQDSALGDQIEDRSINESSLSHTGGDLMLQTPPHTSSPVSSSRSMLLLDISEICDGLEHVTLDEQHEQEDQRRRSCSLTSTPDPFR